MLVIVTEPKSCTHLERWPPCGLDMALMAAWLPKNIVPPEPTWNSEELSLVTMRRPSVPAEETLDCTS